MPGPNYVLDKGFGFSAACPAWYVVTQTGKETAAVAGSLGADPLGICQENLLAGDAAIVAGKRKADVRMMGISRVVVDAAYALGTYVRAAADGRVTALAAATANQTIVGRLMYASAAANDQVDCWLMIGTKHTVP